VSLNLWLIPRMAHVGAAVATLATQAAVTGVLAVLVHRTVGPRPGVARAVKIVVATGAMAAVLHLTRGVGLAVQVPAGAAVYLAALAALRVLSPEEIARLRSDVSDPDPAP
jgi:peptidoglycan biosynthesis protein MviN/MurJ (putative lipid II flippase)